LDTPLSFPRRERARAVEPTTLEKKRAQGMPGAKLAPTASRAN
jgi:hypothetical protein